MMQRTDNTSPLDLESLKELEILVFQMTEIYQRLQYDRDRWSVISMTLKKAVETLQHQIESQATSHHDYRVALTKQLQQESRQILTTLADTVQQTTQQVLTAQVATATTSLTRVVHQAHESLARYEQTVQQHRWRSSLWALGSALLGSVLGGFLVIYVLK